MPAWRREVDVAGGWGPPPGDDEGREVGLVCPIGSDCSGGGGEDRYVGEVWGRAGQGTLRLHATRYTRSFQFQRACPAPAAGCKQHSPGAKERALPPAPRPGPLRSRPGLGRPWSTRQRRAPMNSLISNLKVFFRSASPNGHAVCPGLIVGAQAGGRHGCRVWSEHVWGPRMPRGWGGLTDRDATADALHGVVVHDEWRGRRRYRDEVRV